MGIRGKMLLWDSILILLMLGVILTGVYLWEAWNHRIIFCILCALICIFFRYLVISAIIMKPLKNLLIAGRQFPGQ